jgi:hypothetical protein
MKHLKRFNENIESSDISRNLEDIFKQEVEVTMTLELIKRY